MQPEHLLTVAELADQLHVSVAHIYKLVREAGLPHVRLSPRCIRFESSKVCQWLSERHTAASSA